MKEHIDELRELEGYLRQDFPEYNYDYNFLQRSAEQMKKSIIEFRNIEN